MIALPFPPLPVVPNKFPEPSITNALVGPLPSPQLFLLQKECSTLKLPASALLQVARDNALAAIAPESALRNVLRNWLRLIFA
jgi:hypothetical protein